MAFAFTGTSGTNTATITQTGNFLTITATSAVSTIGNTWQFTGTIGATVQAGATVANCVGRAIVNQTQATTLTAARQIASSWISSIGSVTANATNITVTGHRYFLADGTEDVFQVAVGNVLVVCQNELDLIAAATTDTNFLNDTGIAYSSVTGARADLPWGVGGPALIRLGTAAQATRFVINGYMCISFNTEIVWGPGGNTASPTPTGATLFVSGSGTSAFLMGRHYTLAVGNTFQTRLLYPSTALCSDTLATTHVANMNFCIDSGAYAYFGGSLGGAVLGITTWTRTAATRLHFRKCVVWSVGNTVNTSTNPTIFCGATNGVFTCDELTLAGTHVLQREGSIMNIYSLTNIGAGFIHAVNTNAVIFQGYSNAGSQNGFDFGGYQSYATSAGGTNASIILSYNSPAGTNCYVGSADLTFSAGNNQNINIEFHRNLTLLATNASGTALTTPIAYLKDVTRTVSTTSANPRGAVSAAPDGTQATCGQTVTSRSGTTVLTDNIQVQYDRTYTGLAGGAAIDVLIGECYTNNTTTAATISRVGRPGYEGNSGLATNRISRRGKDDTAGSRTNRDNYDIFWWDYNYLFGKAADFSLNANGTQTQVLLTDNFISQITAATTAAYTALDTTNKVYDYFKYYKVAPGTLDGRNTQTRLELGGVDGTTPGASLANGGGGYLCYPSGSTLFFNPIFSSVTIASGTNATPLQVGAAAQGPINGGWNGTAYTYNAARATSTTTVQGAFTFFAGTATVAASNTFNTLNFGSLTVTLQAQATGAGNWATIAANSITLSNLTVFQNLTATTSITGLLTTGVIASDCVLNVGTATAISMTGDISFTRISFASGTIALTPNASQRNLTLTDCGNLSTFPFSNTTPATIINVVPVGTTVVATLPSGFQLSVNYSVILPNTGGIPTTSVRVNKLYQNPTTAAATTIITPTLTASASGITVSWPGNAADRFAYCAFVDGLTPINFNKPATSAANPVAQGGVVIDPNNLDFTQRANFTAADNTFIAGTTWLIGSGVSFQSPLAIYDRTNSRPISKMVVRALMENGNANPLHFGIATEQASSGVLLRDFLIFTQTGTQTNTAWSVAWSKVTTNNLIALNLWNVDQNGTARNISTTDVTTQVQFFGFSPGPVAELTGADLALIGIVSAEANLPAFNTISSRVNQSSLLIPSTTTPIT